jgi:hypothetical protein
VSTVAAADGEQGLSAPAAAASAAAVAAASCSSSDRLLNSARSRSSIYFFLQKRTKEKIFKDLTKWQDLNIYLLVLRPDRLFKVEFSSSGNGDGGGVTSRSLFLSSSSQSGRFFFFEKLIVVFEGFFFDGDADFTLGFFFFAELTTGATSLKAAAESSALADSMVGGTSPVAILVSTVLVSAPLSSSALISPFLVFFLEMRILFGFGGFT